MGVALKFVICNEKIEKGSLNVNATYHDYGGLHLLK